MAQPNSDIALVLETTGQKVNEKAVECEGGEAGGAVAISVEASPSSTVTEADPHSGKLSVPGSVETQSSAMAARPSQTPLGSQPTSSSTSATQPKRFSAMNINKKFLEKNTASATPAGSPSSSTKTGSSSARPSVQSTASHSRLVTTKLTGNSNISSTTAGWSRPSSVTPSSATNPPSSTSQPPPPSSQTTSSVGPQLPHAGKVIQPQPRAAVAQPNALQMDGAAAKPVWGNRKAPTVNVRPDIQPDDFPTAAEVANVAASRKSAKPEEAKTVAEPLSSTKLRSEEADTFRGVHLDPNARHWDEMEEDDDNFLDGVVEFGDGRQYKIDTSDQASELPSQKDEKDAGPESRVTKEERFVDDFDRSWPRSRESPASASRENQINASSPHVSPVISNLTHSPQDSSRVLFNERSNRLEPYSQSHTSRQAHHDRKRQSSSQEPNSNDHRAVKDGGHNIQVLQKSGGDNPKTRRFSTTSGGGFDSSTPNGSVRENRRDGPPPSPRMTRDHAHHTAPDDRRKGSMGPPPVPSHATRDSGGRQLPPHLSPVSPRHSNRRLSSGQERFSAPSETPVPSIGQPPHSPAVSQSSLLRSPATNSSAALALHTPELEEARKDVMQTAAARAKARRQQEEEEREAQRERARRKAAELEEKMKEAEKAKQKEAEAVALKEKEAVAVIEAAVRSADSGSVHEDQADSSRAWSRRQAPTLPPTSPTQEASGRVSVRQPSFGGRPRPPLSATSASSPASNTDSWRARANITTPSTVPKQIQTRPTATSTTFMPPVPTAAEQVEYIATDESKDALEVVDFSELGEFVGATLPPVSEPLAPAAELHPAPGILSKPSRPSASDFFEDPVLLAENSMSPERKADFGAWRKKVADVTPAESTFRHDTAGSQNEKNKDPESPLLKADTLAAADQSDGAIMSRSTRTAYNKDASMSSLDDTMSRIKGALNGMHTRDLSGTTVLSSSQPDNSSSTATHHLSSSVPMYPRGYHDSEESREVFLVTLVEPSPVPDAAITVRFPSISRPVDFINKKQLFAFSKPPHPARMDILTFEQPVVERNRRTWLLNDVLFGGSFKGKYKYRVILPRTQRLSRPHYPLPKPNGLGNFGRSTLADGAASWRKPLSTPSKPDPIVEPSRTLDTMSRSPPPDLAPSVAPVSIPAAQPSPTQSDGTTKFSRLQPKMPAGSSVAFMRDSRIDVADADTKTSVNFTVGSELENGKPSPLVIESSRVISLKKSDSGVEIPNTKGDGKSDVNHSEESALLTPPPSGLPRASVNLPPSKDSPARAPDPELLRAVWSQTTVNLKAGMPQVNSLEGIADDLTSVPFSIQDVKADESVRLPASLPTAPSRMSLHDVTRAFQTVPTSSSGSSHSPARDRTNFSPPTTNAPVARPVPATAASATPSTSTYSYAPVPSASQSGIRPAYGPYPSPMMTHSPTPLVYGHPSPVPARMAVNGHTYPQTMWMAMPGASPQGPHANVLRPVASPYSPAHMVPYPAAGYVTHPPHQPAPPSMMPQNASGRGRGLPVMSPVVPHAHAHPPYGGSPIMMHATQNHGYMAVPVGRGQPPLASGATHLPPAHQHPPMHAGHPHPPHPPPPSHGFNPGPPTFVRW